MSFELYNISRTFQFFINKTLRKYLNNFCTTYLDDILVYSNFLEKHIEHVQKILTRLQEARLFLDIDKCEFSVNEVKYLKLIITTKEIKINLIKIKTILR